MKATTQETGKPDITELDNIFNNAGNNDDGSSGLLLFSSQVSAGSDDHSDVSSSSISVNQENETVSQVSLGHADDEFSKTLMDMDLLDLDYRSPHYFCVEQMAVDYEFIEALDYEGTYIIPEMNRVLPIVCYKDSDNETMYCIYKSFKSEQIKLINYCLLCIANIGLIAFLIQVFQTRDWVSLIIVSTQFLFIIVCIIELCVMRWAFTKILHNFDKSILPCSSIKKIVYVRADNLCLEIGLKSIMTEDDLSYKNTIKSTVRWLVLVFVQLLTLGYFISCMVGTPPPNITPL